MRTAPTGTVRRDVELTLIDIGLVLFFFFLPHDLESDGLARFTALNDLLRHGRVWDMGYSFVGPLCSAPLYLIGTIVLTPEWWCARFNMMVFAGGLFAVYRLLRDDVDRGLLRTLCLVLIAASMFPFHVREYFGEVFTAVLVAVGAIALQAERPLAGWTAIVLGVVNMPASLVGLALVAMKQTWDTRRWRHLLPIAIAAALIMLESWIRRGGPLVTGYQGNSGARTVMPYSGLPGFSYPLFFGVLAILFSYGKGLIFFAPGLLLPITRRARVVTSERLRASYALWICFLVGLIVVYAKWWAWYGGWFWGPRFFLFASIPASLAIAVWLHEARASSLAAHVAALAALTLSAWVGVSGAVFGQNGLQGCLQNTFALEHLCWFVPEFSVLWHPFVAGLRLTTDQSVIAVYLLVVYVWLALPLAADIVRTSAPRIVSSLSARDFAAWRF